MNVWLEKKDRVSVQDLLHPPTREEMRERQLRRGVPTSKEDFVAEMKRRQREKKAS